MPRPGELNYYEAIGEDRRRYATNKPFSDALCSLHLMQIGAVMAVLPPPPARLLECGCGTGWLSHLLVRHGYDVVGVDVSPVAVDLARASAPFREGPVPTFEVADCEDLPFDSAFDAVLFFDALHHAVDEAKALAGAFRALKPGGVCVTSEPGRGHHTRSRQARARYDVTEKDMPARYIVRLGKQAGFRGWRVLPRLDEIGQSLYGKAHPPPGRLKRLLMSWPLRYFYVNFLMLVGKRDRGIVVLRK